MNTPALDKEEKKIQVGDVLLELAIPLLVIVSFVLVQFPPGSSFLLIGHDAGFPLNSHVWFQNALNVWSSIDSLGTNRSLFIGTWLLHGMEYMFSFLGLSLFTTQKLILIFWFFAMSVSYYIFVSTFYPARKYRWLRIFAPLFYILNFYIVSRFRAYERTAFTLMINLPLTFTILMLYLQDKTSLLRSIALLGLLFFFFNGAGIPPYWGFLWMMIATTLVFHLLITGISWTSLKKTSVFGFLAFIVFFLANAYWVGPFFITNIASYQTITADQGIENIVRWLNEASKHASLLNVLKLQGTDLWVGPALGNPTNYSANFYTHHPLGLFLSLLIPGIVFLSVLFAKRDKDRFFVLYFSFVGLLFIFFSAGSYPPLGQYFLWLIQHVPFFAIYRTPIYKFPYGLIFAFAFLFGFSVYTLIHTFQRRKRTTHIGVLFLFLFLAYNYLYFDRDIFQLNDLFYLRVPLPQYVLQAGDYINKKVQDSRVLLLPMQADNYGGMDVYTWRYSSLTPLPMLMLNKGIIGRKNIPFASAMIEELYDAINDSRWQDAFRYTRLFTIRYLLLRKDVYYTAPNIRTDNPERIEEKLSAGEIPLDREFGPWKLYSVPDEYFTPHIYIPDTLTFVNGDSYDFANIFSLLPSENYSAYYISPPNTASFVPQLPYQTSVVLPGNFCCSLFYKTGPRDSPVQKSLIDDDGVKTVFLNEQFSFRVPKKDRYTLFLRANKPFANAQKIVVTIDDTELKKEVTAEERRTHWIEIGEAIITTGFHSLSLHADGQPIDVMKAGDIALVSQTAPPQAFPSLEFQKISNTKYRVRITGAKEPYSLVFSESFDKEWKLYVSASGRKSQMLPIVASYRDGQIKEGRHTNSAFHADMFETWNMTSLPESRHIMLNGYANAWYILPEDVQGKETYEMIIEYYPQRLFNIGIVISFISVFVFTVTIIHLTFNKHGGIVQ